MTQRRGLGPSLGSIVVIAALGWLTADACAASPAATRLVHPPLVFRIVDRAHSPSSIKHLTYVTVWKFNRVPQPPMGSLDPTGPPKTTDLGDFSIGKTVLGFDTSFGPVVPRSTCISAEFYDNDDLLGTRNLNRVKAGRSVEVLSQPYTPLGDGTWAFGKKTRSLVRMRRTDARFNTPTAVAALRRIGCLTQVRRARYL